MKIGQTSFIVFFAKALSSAIGFLGTIYFARTLGPEIIGIYATIVALITWLQLGGKAGVHSAIKKRLSEGEDRGKYLAAGIFIVGLATLVVVCGVIVLRTYIEQYMNDFSTYTDVSVVWFVVVLFVFQVFYHIINSVLTGEHLVHIVGLLRPVRSGFIRGGQFVLVFFLGFSIVGLVIGHIVGIAVAALLGIFFVSIRPQRPSRKHFYEIYDYAKYSWFGELSTRTFSNADIVILGAFVPSSLVGVYSVSWTLSSFLNLFSGAVSSAVFPEISSIAAKQNSEATAGIIEDAIAYAGLLVIPGVVGGILLDQKLFRVYGEGFGRGPEVFVFLLISVLAYSYLSQFFSALNGLDRPDLVFRTNAAFVFFNIFLNITLIQLIGWVGAAIASAISTVFGAVLSYYFLTRLINITFPVEEIGKQIIAALGMGIVVWIGREAVEVVSFGHPFLVLLTGVVGFGAATYFVLLLLISSQFREIVNRNLPIDWGFFHYGES